MTDQEIESLLDRIALGEQAAAEHLSDHVMELVNHECSRMPLSKSQLHRIDRSEICSILLVNFVRHLQSYRDSGSADSKAVLHRLTNKNYVQQALRYAKIDCIRKIKAQPKTEDSADLMNAIGPGAAHSLSNPDSVDLEELHAQISQMNIKETLNGYFSSRPADAKFLREYQDNPSHRARCESEAQKRFQKKLKDATTCQDWVRKCEQREAKKLSRLRCGFAKFAVKQLTKPHRGSQASDMPTEALSQYMEEVIFSVSIDDYEE